MDTKEVINMFVFLCIDSMMVLLYLIIGILFISSNGRAIRYLTGHDLDENISNKSKELCIICGKQIMKWSLCFIIGFAIDLLWVGAGLILAAILNTVLIIRLMVLRDHFEKINNLFIKKIYRLVDFSYLILFFLQLSGNMSYRWSKVCHK